MSTFQALGVNLLIGSGICTLSLVAFAGAVHFEFNSQLAPRSWARPNEVIKNVLERPYGISWISWALSLSYKEMLEGIPGTGTRRGGWSGSKLKCNLDGIVIIKFHALCYRLAVFATVLCVVVILPLNYTAPCDPKTVGPSVCANLTTLTDFEQTTLANIPAMDFSETEDDETVTDDALSYLTSSIKQYFWTAPGITSRLFGVVVVAWCIYIYACYLIWNEWIENLAMRRVYYLEHNHYEERKEELDYLATLQDAEDPFQEERPPYLPHPELRETTPNVALYSALYKLPKYYHATATSATSSILDRQISATINFFDRCVPNQPGFSSSVAAVTILPDSSQVSNAWKKWYGCAAKLRRLRFIRSQIRRLKNQEEGEIMFIEQGENEPFFSDSPKVEIGILPREDIASSTTPPNGAPQRLNWTESSFSSNHASTSPIKDKVQQPPVTSDMASGSGNKTATVDFQHPLMKVVLSTVEESEGSSEHLGQMPIRTTMTEKQTSEEGVKEAPCGASDTALGIVTSSSTLESEANSAPDGQIVSEKANPLVSDCVSDNETLNAEIGDGVSTASRSEAISMSCQSLHVGGMDDADRPEIDAATAENEVQSRDSEIEFDSAGSLSAHDSKQPYRAKRRLHLAKFDKKRSSTSVGLAEEAQLDMFLSDDGMEQLSVYCREFAQSSAACCPYGWDEYRIRLANLGTLRELEKEAESLVKDANVDLIEARASVNRSLFECDEEGAIDSFMPFQKSREPSLLDEADSGGGHSDLEANSSRVNSSSIRHRAASTERQWQLANEIVQDNRRSKLKRRATTRIKTLASGRWRWGVWNSLRSLLVRKGNAGVEHSASVLKRAASKSGNLVNTVVQHSTYAVVTFTSRQAALAARQCLTDACGLDRWVEVEDIPIPPLADAPAWNLLACRGVCRPVTLTINGNQKRCRNNVTIICLTLFCCLYTIPLSLTSSLLSQDSLEANLLNLSKSSAVSSGILTGLLYTLFFSVCPFIFKAFANFGSSATSVRQAEYRAIRYYWIFILVTAFTGTSLATMVTQGLYAGLNLGQEAQEVLRQVAKTIPTQVSATWMNWIIVRFLFTYPVTYLFQSNTFIFNMLGMKCCSRLMRGGGPGGPLPFRIYVDSGVVVLCTVALAPACPLIAPTAMMYFVIFCPMLRWLIIFVYRPNYDGGGLRWPLLHDMVISSLIVAQILLTTMMVLKKAYGPAALAAFALIPTYLFGQIAKDNFLRCYMDAGLLQTSELDGWDLTQPTSREDREEYRKWLVDCHKASFVPICLAGLDNFLTAEPAIVVVTNRDAEDMVSEEIRLPPRDQAFAYDSLLSTGTQRGALFRRVSSSTTTLSPVSKPSPDGQTSGRQFNKEDDSYVPVDSEKTISWL